MTGKHVAQISTKHEPAAMPTATLKPAPSAVLRLCSALRHFEQRVEQGAAYELALRDAARTHVVDAVELAGLLERRRVARDAARQALRESASDATAKVDR